MTPFRNLILPQDYKIKIGASKSHFTPHMNTVIQSLAPVELIRMGGAGYKCHQLA
jgi:hypothetical protein